MPLSPRPLAHGRTIDPPDAADLDDATYVRKHPWGWRVCVSIADVAEHVPIGGEVDRQAYEQGLSHYFADRQDPMLPLEMAVDRLSLLAGQPRDALTFHLALDADFAITALDIQKTRLQSDAQLTYDDVSAVLDAPHHPDYAYWRDALDLAYGLLRQRQGLGALALFDPLSGCGSTEEGRLVRLPEGAACRAYLIVQELMILVNHAVTRHLTAQGLPLLFRNHTLRLDGESGDDASALAAFRLDPSAERLGRLGHLLNRAVYHPVNQGHLGLRLPCYAHWTSPIRRYSDLVNHRQLRAWLGGETPPYSHEALVAIGEHLSEAARTARQARQDDDDQAEDELLRQAGEAELAELDRAIISRLIERLAEGRLDLNDLRLAELQRRLQDGALTPGDLMRLLLAPETQGPWVDLKADALAWLTTHPAEAMQVYHAAHHAHGWPPLNALSWRESQCGPPHAAIFNAEVSLAHERWQAASPPVQSATRRGARQRALLSLLSRLVGVDIALPAEELATANPEPTPPAPPAELAAIANPKGLLLEIARRQHAKTPTFNVSCDGPSHLRQFVCVAALDLHGRAYRSAPHGAWSKRDAERASALDLLAQLPVQFTKTPPRRGKTLVITPDKNPVSLLQEWTSQRLCKQPHYAFERSGPSHAPVFVCICRVKLADEVHAWQGTGSTKKEAKTQAAQAACESLLDPAASSQRLIPHSTPSTF